MDKKELTKLVSAFVIGDGHLRKLRSTGCNSMYSLGQVATHREYVEWQASILENITPTTINVEKAHVDKDGTNHKEKLRLTTRSHPFFTTLRERWYMGGRKVLSLHDLKLLDWQVAAILYMDDGFILRSSDRARGDMTICTDNFTHAEVVLLQKALYEKLEVPFNIRRRPAKNEVRYRLTCPRKYTDRFIDGISKYVFNSFQYKLHTNSILTNQDGDIV